MGLIAKIPINLDIVQSKTDNWGEFIIKPRLGNNFTDGTGADQMDVLWADNRTAPDNGSDDLNLHDGSISDAFGDPFTLDILKVLYIKNNSEDTHLIYSGSLPIFAAPLTTLMRIMPGGFVLMIAPDANGVDVTTNDLIQFQHTGTGDLPYDIIVAGVD